MARKVTPVISVAGRLGLMGFWTSGHCLEVQWGLQQQRLKRANMFAQDGMGGGGGAKWDCHLDVNDQCRRISPTRRDTVFLQEPNWIKHMQWRH